MVGPFAYMPMSLLLDRMNIRSWCGLEMRFAPVRNCETDIRSANAQFSQRASRTQSNTAWQRERSSRKCSKRGLSPGDHLPQFNLPWSRLFRRCGRQRQRVAGLFLRWLIKARPQAAERVFGPMRAPGAIAEDQQEQCQGRAQRRQRQAPVDLGQLQHDDVQEAARP